MFHHFAYLDAGTGSMVIQAVIGIFLAGSLIFRSTFAKVVNKVKSLFKSKKSTEKDE